jgi:hypothetical protein
MIAFRYALALVLLGLIGALGAGGAISAPPPAPALTARFAVIGDYGTAGQPEQDVATLVHSWNPDFVVTVGDNNYPDGAANTIDPNIGQYYHDFIFPYTGSYGPGAPFNQFWPALGNHDWNTPGAQPYLDYFTLPNNERYYEQAMGPVHLFIIDSDPHEPDGITFTSTQALWLQGRLAAATEPWKLVFLHHPPYSSGINGSTPALQWPYREWGASAVLAGHDHHYERILDPGTGFPYFVDGSGGTQLYPTIFPIPGSQIRYWADYGAMRLDATDTTLRFQFINRANALIDTYTLTLGLPTLTATPTPTASATATPTGTPIPSATATTPLPTSPPGTPAPTLSPSPTPTVCPIQFNDASPGSTFYTWIRCLACRGIVSGYPCGGPGEPCPGAYFRPGNNVTRGQVAKIVSNAAGYSETPTAQTFEDVPPTGTFYLWVERIASRGIISGYPCGQPGEPCTGPGNRPYFRPNNNVTRGQLAKIDANAAQYTETPTGQAFEDAPPGSTFYLWIERIAVRGIISGYPCGGPGEPCVAPANRPYFRPNAGVTRGQTAKIVANTFFPGCATPARSPSGSSDQ